MRQHIDKEQLNTYPLAQFGGYVKVVSKLEHMAEAMEYLCAQSVVGVDTETRPSFVKGVHYPTALVQIATLERCYLFQINRMGMPEELADFFANPSIRKVGLAFKDDHSSELHRYTTDGQRLRYLRHGAAEDLCYRLRREDL